MVRRLLRDDQWMRNQDLLPGNAGIRGEPARTIGDSSRRCCGLPVREALDAICPRSWATGTRPTRALRAGAALAYERGWPRSSARMPIWRNCSLIRLPYGPISTLPAPQRSGAASPWPVPGRTDHQDSCGGRHLGQSPATVAHRGADSRYRTSRWLDLGHPRRRGDRRQRIQQRCLGAGHSGHRRLGGHSPSLQPQAAGPLRLSSVNRSQFDQAASAYQEVPAQQRECRQDTNWCAVATYVLIAIVKKELHLEVSPYTVLQVLSVSVFEKLQIRDAFATLNDPEITPQIDNQLNLLEI